MDGQDVYKKDVDGWKYLLIGPVGSTVGVVLQSDEGVFVLVCARHTE